jgi:arsenate reductase
MTGEVEVMSLPAVLFLCTGNSARSQMAEALLRRHAGDRFEVYSAGIEPKGIHPLTVQVMNEIGIPLEGHRSKSVDEFLGKVSVRYAIIVCESAERECPRLYPFAVNRLSWHFADPAAAQGSLEEQLSCFRDIRDQIDRRIQDWLRIEKPA